MVAAGKSETGFTHCGKCFKDHSSFDMNGIVCKTGDSIKKPVLLVEDDTDVSSLLAEFVDSMRLYTVVKASTVKEARDLFCPGKFFAILLDLGLEGSVENGIRLAQYLRDNDDNVFIAVITGYYPIFDARLIESIDDLMGKPVNMEELQTKLFMWSIKYNRRLALKQYIDARTLTYLRELDDIRRVEIELRTKASVLATKLGLVIDVGDHEESSGDYFG